MRRSIRNFESISSDFRIVESADADFTAVRSRYRFVYPTFEETTARAIEACDAAWAFYGGIFTVLISDNTKAIIIQADPLAPRITPAFLEYAQRARFTSMPRGCGIRATRRLERAVPTVRDECVAGEVLTSLEEARTQQRSGAATTMADAVTVAPSDGRVSILRSGSRP